MRGLIVSVLLVIPFLAQAEVRQSAKPMTPAVEEIMSALEKYSTVSTAVDQGEALTVVELAGAYRLVLVVAKPSAQAPKIAQEMERLQLGDIRYAQEEGNAIVAAKWNVSKIGRSRSTDTADIPAIKSALAALGLKARVAVRYPKYGTFTGDAFQVSDSQRSHWIDATTATKPIRLDVELPSTAPMLVFLFLAFPGVLALLGLLGGIIYARNEAIDISKRRRLYPKIVYGMVFGSMFVHTPIFLVLMMSGAIRPIVDLWMGTSKITALTPVLLGSVLLLFAVLPLNMKIEKKLFGPGEIAPEAPQLTPEEAASAKKAAWITTAPMLLGLACLFGPRMFGVSSSVSLGFSFAGLFLVLGSTFFGKVLLKKAGIDATPTEDSRATALAADVAARMQVTYKKVEVTHMPGDRATITASAASDGTISISERALADLTDEELSSLIAHELAHLKLRHNQKRQRLLVIAMVIVVLPMLALILLRELFANPALRVGLMAVPLLGYPLFFIAFRRVMRNEEFEADALAVDTVGNPVAYESALSKLVRSSPMPHWHEVDDLSTHPAMGSRIRAIRARST